MNLAKNLPLNPLYKGDPPKVPLFLCGALLHAHPYLFKSNYWDQHSRAKEYRDSGLRFHLAVVRDYFWLCASGMCVCVYAGGVFLPSKALGIICSVENQT